MEVNYQALIEKHCRPLAPEPTDAEPRLCALPEMQAVLFDVYGTMLVSGSGDIDADAELCKNNAFREATESVGLTFSEPPEVGVERFRATVLRDHARRQDEGIEFPEIDVVDVWRRVLGELAASSPAATTLVASWQAHDFERFALEYELRVNPVWPMPKLTATLGSLRKSCLLGVVSNAQFYTPILFSALMHSSLSELGFHRALNFYSFEHRQAKPGTHLFELARQALQARGILAAQALFVGNDMLNDIAAAAQVGFRTALFAGDGRSLRWRLGDSRVDNLQPDIVITDLLQLPPCLHGDGQVEIRDR